MTAGGLAEIAANLSAAGTLWHCSGDGLFVFEVRESAVAIKPIRNRQPAWPLWGLLGADCRLLVAGCDFSRGSNH